MGISAFFIIAYAFISRDGFVCTIPLQSVFFILALTKSGILQDLSREDKCINFSKSGLIKGVLCIMAGFALSLLFIIIFTRENLFDFAVFSILIMSLYFCFFGVHSAMLICGKNPQNIKHITVISTLFPCIATISGFKANSCLPLSAVLLVIGSLPIQKKKMNQFIFLVVFLT